MFDPLLSAAVLRREWTTSGTTRPTPPTNTSAAGPGRHDGREDAPAAGLASESRGGASLGETPAATGIVSPTISISVHGPLRGSTRAQRAPVCRPVTTVRGGPARRRRACVPATEADGRGRPDGQGRLRRRVASRRAHRAPPPRLPRPGMRRGGTPPIPR